MELSNYFSLEEIAFKNTVASANDRNSSRDYQPTDVIAFMQEKGVEAQRILQETFDAMEEETA